MYDYPSQQASKGIEATLNNYRSEMKEELNEILSYWIMNTHDAVNGGFLGRIDENNVKHPDAPKGAVLNSRILWAFASAYELTRDPEHLHLARIAFNYLLNHFVDKDFGGVYWSVTATGQPLDTKKQIYALAFAIYGCCAYYQAAHNEVARETAIDLYRQIEQYSFDRVNGGYFEAFTREWQAMADMRLSAKDANEKKTMNTHLHVLEAYSSLYKIWPEDALKISIRKLLENFTHHIIDPGTGHLKLFFDDDWNSKSAIISYGHDIEAAWLLLEAAKTIAELPIIERIRSLSQKISAAAATGLDPEGALWYEYDWLADHHVKEKHWWVQAEAMVGFFNEWQLTGDVAYLERSLQCWRYTKEFIRDKVHGEWLWGRNEMNDIMAGQDKVGIWKCPYHNTRACVEIIKRITYV
jgi:cellobiose epimerase